MYKKIKSAKFKRGFTLIELIVVVIVIGILALLAIPKFMGQIDKAKETHIINDVRVVESKVGEYLIEHGDLTKWGAPIGALDGDELYNKRGLIDSDNPITGGPFRGVSEEVLEEVKSHLDGTFYSNDLGEVYYSKEEFIGNPSYTDEEINDKIKLGYIPIATPEDLDSIRSDEKRLYGKGTEWAKEYEGGLDKHYVQVANVDLSEYSEESWNPIGTGYDEDWNLITFTGTYDGGNYVITNLEIKSDNDDYQGLFGSTLGATLRNIGLIDNKVTGKERVGGLVGEAYYGSIENSYATGSVEGTGGGVGGLVGFMDGTIENSYATGSVTGTGDNVGGLVGFVSDSTNKISNSYAKGSVEGNRNVGGLVGFANSNTEITNSYAKGSVTGTGDHVGGLVGFAASSNTRISNSYATGEVTGTGGNVGGLVGFANSNTEITNSYAKGSVTGTGGNVGGLVGFAASSNTRISNSYATGEVTGAYYAGGLVGYANSNTEITNSYATGEVTGAKNYVGGLVGFASTFTKISNSYAAGSVAAGSATGYSQVGGLVGEASYNTTISNSYATGSVEGSGEYVGGLVGDANTNTIENSYSTGPVEGSGDYVGGLVGRDYNNNSTVSNSYWDKDTTGQEKSDGGGEGKTTEEMKLKETYTNWNFEETWDIDEGVSYPTLR